MSKQTNNSSFFQYINENKYFIGFTMILLNIGARFIIDELDDDIRKIISDKIVRKLFIFCSFFMATKDIVAATILTGLFIVIVNELISTDVDEKDENSEKGGSFNKMNLKKPFKS